MVVPVLEDKDKALVVEEFKIKIGGLLSRDKC